MKKYQKAFIPFYGIYYVCKIMSSKEIEDFYLNTKIYFGSAFAQTMYIILTYCVLF